MNVNDKPREKGKASGAYDIDILNTLGRDQKKARNQLYQEAIKNPDKYLKTRNDFENNIIDNVVHNIYKEFKDLLLSGKYKGVEYLKYPNDDFYMPCLPEATITKFAIRASETLEKLYEEMFEEIYPSNLTQLATVRNKELGATGAV